MSCFGVVRNWSSRAQLSQFLHETPKIISKVQHKKITSLSISIQLFPNFKMWISKFVVYCLFQVMFSILIFQNWIREDGCLMLERSCNLIAKGSSLSKGGRRIKFIWAKIIIAWRSWHMNFAFVCLLSTSTIYALIFSLNCGFHMPSLQKS